MLDTALDSPITITNEWIGVQDEEDWPHVAWISELSFEGRKFSVPFRMGLALEREPSADDVLESLLLDYTTSDSTFEQWCLNYGYDTDSIKARDLYRQTQTQSAGFLLLLGGEDNVTRLAETAEYYL